MLSKFSPSMVEDYTIKFKNTAKDICAFASLASAMHYQAQKLKVTNLKSALCNNANTLFQMTKNYAPWVQNPFTIISKCLHRSRSLLVERHSIHNFHPSNVQTAQPHVYYLAVLKSPSGYSGHCVVFHNGLVFDSNFDHPFPISKTTYPFLFLLAKLNLFLLILFQKI